MKKRLLALFLALVMVLALCSTGAFAVTEPTSGVCGQNATWNFNSNTGTLTISGTGEMNNYQGALLYDLQGQISWQPAPWNNFAEEIKSVVISSGITNIGSYAFKNCGFRTISIPDSVSFIGYSSFSGCKQLEQVTIPDSVTELYSNTFSGCSNLTSVSIPSSVTAIYEDAFKGCSSLSSVSIPNHVEKIDRSTFQGCSSLTSVYIPESVVLIRDKAFDGCTSLTDVYYSGHKVQWEQIEIIGSNTPLIATTIYFEQGPDPFQKTDTYTPGQFTDVSDSSWYAEYVQCAYEYGMINGVSDTSFDPNGNLTVASAIVIACRLHSLYYRDSAVFSSGSPWYQPYVDYAQENKIIDLTYAYAYNSPITRADFALLISNALPDNALQKINEIAAGEIPDVTTGSPYDDAINALTNAGVLEAHGASKSYLSYFSFLYSNNSSDSYKAIYRLYRAGVLTGNDIYGTFTPDANITRAAVAAIVSRVSEPALRQQITMTPMPVQLVPMNQLENLYSIQKKASNAELAQAYEAAKEIVEPLANLSRETQLYGTFIALRLISDNEVTYSMNASHYNDPYGFFILHTASCAGDTRATGLCLNMLGISYEHVNENAYSHQWTRVNINGTYWICDAYGLYCGPEEEPYKHPNVS